MSTSSARIPILDEAGRFPDRFAPPSVALDAAAASAAKTAAQTSAADASAAQQAAEVAAAEAIAVGNTNDTIMATTLQDPNSQTATALNAAIGSKVAPIAATISPSINRWKAKLARDPYNAKVVLVGDSTSDPATEAVEILNRLRNVHTLPGEGLEGMNLANITSQGRNGSKLLTEWMVNQSWTDAVVAASPDLIIFSLGINDIRAGLKTAAEIKAGIISYVNTLMGLLPNVDFVLRTPNTFLIDDPSSAGTLIPQASAQQYSTDLRNVYDSLTGQWPNAVVWSAPDRIFGRTSPLFANSRGLWKDTLHPSRDVGYPLIADYLVKDAVGHPCKAPYTKPRDVDMIQASRASSPYIFGDRADRADSTTSAGNMSSGLAYTVINGTAGVLGNRLYAPVSTAGITVDPGVTNLEFGLTLAAIDTTANDHLVMLRTTNLANYIAIRAYRKLRYELISVVAGVTTIIAANTRTLPANGDRVRIMQEGSQVKVFVNYWMIFDATITALQGVAPVGMYLPTAVARYVDFWGRKLPVV